MKSKICQSCACCVQYKGGYFLKTNNELRFTTTEPDLIVKASSISGVFRVKAVHSHNKRLEAVRNKVNSLVQATLNLFNWIVDDTCITIFPRLNIVDATRFYRVVHSSGELIVTHTAWHIMVHPSGAWACIDCEKFLCKIKTDTRSWVCSSNIEIEIDKYLG